jgi:hypothetical protein
VKETFSVLSGAAKRRNSFSHGHTHHHEIHALLNLCGSGAGEGRNGFTRVPTTEKGSVGATDLWPLCRVSPFNNQ